MPGRSLVCVVDDDESVREALPDLLRKYRYDVRSFSSAEEFLESNAIHETECLILDVAMPGMSGLDLQQELKARQKKIPIIFITARNDVAAAKVIQEGAIACLLKPFTNAELLEALKSAFSMGE